MLYVLIKQSTTYKDIDILHETVNWNPWSLTNYPSRFNDAYKKLSSIKWIVSSYFQTNAASPVKHRNLH